METEMILDSGGLFHLPEQLKHLSPKAKISLLHILVPEPLSDKGYPEYLPTTDGTHRFVYRDKFGNPTGETLTSFNEEGELIVTKTNFTGVAVSSPGDDPWGLEGNIVQMPSLERSLLTGENKRAGLGIDPQLGFSAELIGGKATRYEIDASDGSYTKYEGFWGGPKFGAEVSKSGVQGEITFVKLGGTVTRGFSPELQLDGSDLKEFRIVQRELGAGLEAGISGKIAPFSKDGPVDITTGVSPELVWTMHDVEKYKDFVPQEFIDEARKHALEELKHTPVATDFKMEEFYVRGTNIPADEEYYRQRNEAIDLELQEIEKRLPQRSEEIDTVSVMNLDDHYDESTGTHSESSRKRKTTFNDEEEIMPDLQSAAASAQEAGEHRMSALEAMQAAEQAKTNALHELEEIQQAKANLLHELEEIHQAKVAALHDLEEAQQAKVSALQELEHIQETRVAALHDLEETQHARGAAQHELQETEQAKVSAQHELQETEHAKTSAQHELQETEHVKISAQHEFHETEQVKGAAQQEFHETSQAKLSAQQELHETEQTKGSAIEELHETAQAKGSAIQELHETEQTKDSAIQELHEIEQTKEAAIQELHETVQTKETAQHELQETLQVKETANEELERTREAHAASQEVLDAIKLVKADSDEEYHVIEKTKGESEETLKDIHNIREDTHKELNLAHSAREEAENLKDQIVHILEEVRNLLKEIHQERDAAVTARTEAEHARDQAHAQLKEAEDAAHDAREFAGNL